MEHLDSDRSPSNVLSLPKSSIIFLGSYSSDTSTLQIWSIHLLLGLSWQFLHLFLLVNSLIWVSSSKSDNELHFNYYSIVIIHVDVGVDVSDSLALNIFLKRLAAMTVLAAAIIFLLALYLLSALRLLSSFLLASSLSALKIHSMGKVTCFIDTSFKWILTDKTYQ